MRILLTIAYDGTNYAGWQKQTNACAVQNKLEEALCQAYKEGISVLGASRTDTGVHALGQRAAYKLNENSIHIPLKNLPFVINKWLPRDIVIHDAIGTSDRFHPISDVVKKTYEYKILNSYFSNPIIRNSCCQVYAPLDLGQMQEAAEYFVGEHDFKAFCAAGTSAQSLMKSKRIDKDQIILREQNTVRTIHKIELAKDNDIITIKVTGNGFLYNMVRIIAGTLIDVGKGKKKADNMRRIIESKDRNQAGMTAEARGLTLLEVFYSPEAIAEFQRS